MRANSVKRSLSLLLVLAMMVSMMAIPALAAAPADGTVTMTGPVTTETKSVSVTVTGCDSFIGGYLFLTTGPAAQGDADSRQQVASVPFTGANTYEIPIREGAVLPQGETLLVHVYRYDSESGRTMYGYGNALEITAPEAPKPEKPTPEQILANCSAVILKDGAERTEAFQETETSTQVQVKLDSSVKQCYLTVFAYASNTAFDPDASHNDRLWSGFVEDGQTVDCTFSKALEVGYSVIACLNVPVAEDWYRPVNSQSLKIVDQNGQGFENYDPYPDAWINDQTLEAGAATMHISLVADERLFQAARDGHTTLNIAVRQYPDGHSFDFEAEDQITVYNAVDVTAPLTNQEITLTEPLKAGYRVRAVVYWDQNPAIFLPKGNDYEEQFHRPDDSLLIAGEVEVPAPVVTINGTLTPSVKNFVVTAEGQIPAGSRLLVKAYGPDEAVEMAKGTLVGAAEAAASVTLTPAAGSLTAGGKAVAFLLDAGKLVAQSQPVTVGEDAPPAPQGTITLAGPITTETRSATVTVGGYEEFQGGRLILTVGPASETDSDNRKQIANEKFTGAGTGEYAFYDGVVLTKGETVMAHLYKYDSETGRTQFAYSEMVEITDAVPPVAADKIEIVDAVNVDTKTITVKVEGCEAFKNGRLILTAGPASNVDDADSRMQVSSVPFTGAGTYEMTLNPGAVLPEGQSVLVHLYRYDSESGRTMYKYGNFQIIAAAETPEVKPGETPEEILANCSVVLMKDGKERTEAFRENETSVDVKVQLDPGVEQCYLTVFSYASNTAFEPDATHNIRLGSQFVKNGDIVTIDFNPDNLPLKVGCSVIATLNVPVAPDWYKPSNSQALKIVDENGQGFEDYDPYPNASIVETSLEPGATSLHISLEADPRLYQAAREKKTSLNLAVAQYPADADFDFESEAQTTLYSEPLITDPIDNKLIQLSEPLKAGYRVRAIVYWEQCTDIFLIKGNDYEAQFHRPDDSVVVSGEMEKPVELTTAIEGSVTPSSKTVSVATQGEIPAEATILVKAFGGNEEPELAKGTLVGSAAAAAKVTVTPAENSLKTGDKLVAFLVEGGKVLAQSQPLFVGKDAEPSPDGTIAINEAITVDTKSATVTVTGCEEFKGGRLIVTLGDSVYDDRQLANVEFNGEGTYTVNFSPIYTLREGEKVLPYLFNGRTQKYLAGTVSVIGGNGPVELSAAIQGQVKTDSKAISVKLGGDIPAGAMVIVKSFAKDQEAVLSGGTLVGADKAAAAVVTVTPAKDSLKTGEKLVAFLVEGGKVLAQSAAVEVLQGAEIPETPEVTVTITDKVVTAGDTRVNASADWDRKLADSATYVLYQFSGETLNKETAAKLSEGKVSRSYPHMIMNVRDQLVAGEKLQVVLTLAGQEYLSNVIVVGASPDWGTPSAAIEARDVPATAVAIPVLVQYDEAYLTLGDDFYCDVTIYQVAAEITDEEFAEKEMWENPTLATRVGQINSRLGDETLGHVQVPVIQGVELIPGSRLIVKLRLPHTEWEGEEVDYLSAGVEVVEPLTMDFEDVPVDSWYYTPVEFVFDSGLMSGVSDTRFDPYGTTTRAMLITTLYQMAGRPAVKGEVTFRDVDANAYYYPALCWAVESGLAVGYDADSFGPYNAVTRQEAVAILYKFVNSPAVTGSLEGYADASSVSGYAKDAMIWAVAAGVISGRENNLLAPRGTLQRCELAAVLFSLCAE